MNKRLGMTSSVLRATSLATVVAVALVGCGGSKKGATKAASPSASPSAPPPPICPLTGASPSGGSVPNRPALAIKVENSPESRPPTGFETADIIYEEPVEGGITRFVVIYHCQDAQRVEPVRSARIQDVDILSQFNKPLFGDAGGAPPTEAEVAKAAAAGKLVRVSYSGAGYHRDPARGNGEHSLFTSTKELYDRPENKGLSAPKPVFTYSATAAAGGPGATVHINFSRYADVVWKWNASANAYQRFYGTAPANLSTGSPISTQNIVIMSVPVTMSSFIEDPSGSHQPIPNLIGTGAAVVCRGGTCVTGKWNRPSAADLTQYVDVTGTVIPLTPGATWVSIAPASVTGATSIPVAQVTETAK